MPARVLRIIATVVAVAIVLVTGVAWSKIRSFEQGINHISAAALGGGGDDGAIDILLVGMDSRTDAHGNPLSADELATLHAGDDGKTKINGVFGQVKLEKMKQLVENQGLDPAVAEREATEAGREALIKT